MSTRITSVTHAVSDPAWKGSASGVMSTASSYCGSSSPKHLRALWSEPSTVAPWFATAAARAQRRTGLGRSDAAGIFSASADESIRWSREEVSQSLARCVGFGLLTEPRSVHRTGRVHVNRRFTVPLSHDSSACKSPEDRSTARSRLSCSNTALPATRSDGRPDRGTASPVVCYALGLSWRAWTLAVLTR